MPSATGFPQVDQCLDALLDPVPEQELSPEAAERLVALQKTLSSSAGTLFSALAPEDLETVAKSMREREVKEGELITVQGQGPVEGLVILGEGSAEGQVEE